jgi:histone H2B
LDNSWGTKAGALTSASILATEGGAKKSVSAKKSAAPAAEGDKKKRKKARKETYSSYIYKGT